MPKVLCTRLLLLLSFAWPMGLLAQFPFNCNSFEWVNPLPTSNTYYAVDFLGPDTIHVGGDRQTFLRSTDGGQSWEKLQVDFGNYTVRDIEFLDADTAIVAAQLGNQGRIYRSTDGGASWNQAVPSFFGGSYDIQFLDHDTGFVATTIGLHLTTDAGQSWTNLGNNPSSGTKVHFVNRDTGMVISGTTLIKRTTDGGVSWSNTTLPNGALQDFAFVDADTGYVFGGIGYWFKTTDAGASWASHPNPGIFGIPYLMAFRDSIGYASSISGFTTYYYKSTDYGNTFTPIYTLPQHNVMYGIEFRTADQGVAVGRYGTMFLTDDGGANVTRLPAGPFSTTDYLYQMDFPTPDSGFATGRGQVLFTSDGGQTWTGQPAPFTGSYTSLDFYDHLTGLVIGPSVAARTTNGGQTWLNVTLGGNNLDCQFANDSVVYVVGVYNSIRKSTNAGQSWTNLPLGTNGVNYYDVAFSDEMNGVVVGSGGTLNRTTDGGNTWTLYPTGTNLDLIEAYFQDSLNGHVGGDAGIYFRTTDGGDTWSQAFIGGGVDITEFSFVDSLTGFVLFSDGFGDQIYQTNDRGQSWFRVYLSNSSLSIYSIHFFNEKEGIGSGALGTLLRYRLGLTAPTAQDESRCGPGSVLLTASGGYNYVWYADSTLGSPLFNGASYTTPLLTETDTFFVREINQSLNCQSDPVQVVVTLLPQPELVALPADSLCDPDSLDLATTVLDTTATAGTLSFWLDSATTLPAANPVTSGGLYYVQKTTSDGCADLQEVEAFFFPTPQLFIQTPDTVCAPDTVDLTVLVTDSAATNGNLLWYTDAALTQILANPAAVDTTGWYYLVKTTPEGCMDLDSVLVVVETCTGLAEALSPEWETWPNPTTGNLSLRNGAGIFEEGKWSLFGTNGQLLLQGGLDPSQTTWQLNLSALPAGNYWLLLQTDGKIMRRLLGKH